MPGPPPQLCTVPGCGAKHRAKGMCALHYERRKHGRSLNAPLDPRQAIKQARHHGRSHRAALRELAIRLQALHVVADQSHAHEFVAYLAAYWPATDLFEDGEWMEVQGPVGDPSMFGL